MAGPSTRRVLTHAELDERLIEELARAARGDRPTTLAMAQTKPGECSRFVDVALARLRAGDLVARWGGDQVELLLPDTSREHAALVLSRLAEGSDVEVGLAMAPEDGRNSHRLMRVALDALGAKLGRSRAPLELRADAPLEDDASVRALAELTAALERGNVLVTGETSIGKLRFARRAHAALLATGRPGVLVVVPCAKIRSGEDLTRAVAGDPTVPVTVVLEEVTELEGDALAALPSALGVTRVVATHSNDRPRSTAAPLAAFADPLTCRVVELPPLRERPLERERAARCFAEEYGGRVRFSAGALAQLGAHPWPGNLLELRNAIERAVALAPAGEILAEHLPGAPVGEESGLRAQVDVVERDAIQRALLDAGQNQTNAARVLGLSRRALIYKMEKYGLKAPPGTPRRPPGSRYESDAPGAGPVDSTRDPRKMR